ncbi:hypothetical protein [Tenacibaculum singaporense]|nr:hypothetical protein [Tenacibaculum singaporense]
MPVLFLLYNRIDVGLYLMSLLEEIEYYVDTIERYEEKKDID